MQAWTRMAVHRCSPLSVIRPATPLVNARIAIRPSAGARVSTSLNSTLGSKGNSSRFGSKVNKKKPALWGDRLLLRDERSTRFSSQAAKGSLAAPEKVTSEQDGDAEPDFFVYNTMTRQKEKFTPRDSEGNKVSMYVCGITVYDFSHIGHARAYVAFDVLFRYLQSRGYAVSYCRNFTDVDDKIINRAAENGEDPFTLTARFIAEFHKDMQSLNCLQPTMEPKVTENIENIIKMIGDIIDNGHAYPADGDVYFDVQSFENYGALSRRKSEDNKAGESGRVAVGGPKRNSADFALWKGAKAGEVKWDSPWGPGRPGWHIECSAMISATFGSVIDIHGGGADLVFPHHENELAQSKAACAHNDVRYWMHNGFVTIDNEKMSKSLKNFFTIREVLQVYHPMALRWLLLGTHYRSPINYSKRGLEEGSDRVYYLYQTLADADAAVAGATPEQAAAAPAQTSTESVAEMQQQRAAALADDLNTPNVLGQLASRLKALNDLLTTKKGRKTKDRVYQLTSLAAEIRKTLDVIGMPQSTAEVLAGLREMALIRADLTEADIAQSIEDRKALRTAKEYEKADALRESLEARGVVLMDTPQGTTWRPSVCLED